MKNELINFSDCEYSVSILGDTHFDASPSSVYHSEFERKYGKDPHQFWRPYEFARNAKMWAGPSRKILEASGKTVGKNTRFVIQTGDIIQGDCADPEVHKRMLKECSEYMRSVYPKDLPFVTVCGNHDVRDGFDCTGYDNAAAPAYREFMGGQTTYGFRAGPDLYVMVDFSRGREDVDIVKRVLAENKDVRYTFVVVHAGVFPFDIEARRWFYLGWTEDDDIRREMRKLFAERNAIVICGHTHHIEFKEAVFPEGRIDEFTMNTVFGTANGADNPAVPDVLREGPAAYGDVEWIRSSKELDGLFDEYRPYMRRYFVAHGVGHAVMRVSDEGVVFEYYGLAALTPTRTWTVPRRFPACGETVVPRTFCNPLPLPNYPLGMHCRGQKNGDPVKVGWNTPYLRQFRELADPSFMYENGTWYVYPSCDQCWKSLDDGATWLHVPLNLAGKADDRIGYAPTIVKHRGEYLLMGSRCIVLKGPTPEGPWQELGRVDLVTMWPGDPMLFSDDDGRLYLYYGCSEHDGIWGCELDPENPTKVISELKQLVPVEIDKYPWEAIPGSKTVAWMEGSWMAKVDGKYVLTFSSSGTEHAVYAMGQAVSESPLGPFVKRSDNPFFITPAGPITGTGHGSLAEGPSGWWVGYTILLWRTYRFERMIGFDRIGTDGNGFSHAHATSTPQWLPDYGSGATGWEKLCGKVTPRCEAAVDDDFKTVWQTDKLPAEMTIDFGGKRIINAYRLIWCDTGLDEERGVKRGPYQYTLEGRIDGEWQMLADASQNEQDLYIDYREVNPATVDAVRLTVLGGPAGISPAVAEFTPFGFGIIRS